VVNLVLAPEGDGRWTEYAGGYSDMLAQRGADLAARKATKVKAAAADARAAAAPTSPGPPAGKRKLSFNEKHALQTLPKEIDTLHARVRALHAKLDDPAFYARDPNGFAAASEQLAGAQAQLAAAEERWLELELLREEIAGG
jgi:ATP-binding cassette subfamily F protein uup